MMEFMLGEREYAIEVYKEVLLGSRKKFPNYFWSDFYGLEHAKYVVRYLIEEKLKWSDEQVKKKLSHNTFKRNKLGGMIAIIFSSSPFAAIDNAYPEKYKEWELSRVPVGFWTLEKAKEATRWLIEEKLKWNDEQVKENMCNDIFVKNKFGGMLSVLFNASSYAAIENAYPGKYKAWEFKNVPNNFWNLETAKEATRWLIEEKLKWSDEQVKKSLCRAIFKQNDLEGMLQVVFNSNSFRAIENAYPGKYKEWEFKVILGSRALWNLETAKEATKWLIEEKLKWNDEQVRDNLCLDTFKENELGGMISVLFKGSSFGAIENAYPGKYKAWEFKFTPRSFWNLETAKEATKWLIEEKLKWSDEQVRDNLCLATFKENGLGGMIIDLFNASSYAAIENAYPGKYKAWEFKFTPKNFWNLETAKEATKWLIEEKLKWNDEQVRKNIKQIVFIQNGLSGMLTKVFNGSIFAAIENAYPGKYKPWEFKSTPRNFWNLETAKEATKWLIEEKLKWSDEQVRENFTSEIFVQNRLCGMLRVLFKGSSFAALENAYPGKYSSKYKK